MKIIWENINEEKYDEIISSIMRNNTDCGDCVGSLLIGDIRVDLSLEYGFSGKCVLMANVYAGGIDAGYSFTTEGNLPYDFVKKINLINDENLVLFETFDVFKQKIENIIINFVETSDYFEDGRYLSELLDTEEVFNWV